MEDGAALTDEKIVTFAVALRAMRIAIDFYDQTFGRAEEIGDVRADNVLTAKFVSAKLRPAQLFPKDLFKRSGRVSEVSGAFRQFSGFNHFPHPRPLP
jgi:hypothetical protein